MHERKQKQIKIAEILFELGLDTKVIETITDVSIDELNKIN